MKCPWVAFFFLGCFLAFWLGVLLFCFVLGFFLCVVVLLFVFFRTIFSLGGNLPKILPFPARRVKMLWAGVLLLISIFRLLTWKQLIIQNQNFTEEIQIEYFIY